MVGIAQTVRTRQGLVADQPVMDECAFDALQEPQRFEGHSAPLGVRGQPGEHGSDGAVQPVQLAFEADTGLIGMDDWRCLDGLANGGHRGLQGARRVLGKALDAGLRQAQAVEVFHEDCGARQRHQVVLVEVHGHGFDAGAILGRRIDTRGPCAYVGGSAGACPSEFAGGL